MAAARPYQSLEALRAEADAQWWRLGEFGWMEAFRAHTATAAWTEVSDLFEPDLAVEERMAFLHEYYATFGFNFVYYSVGKSGQQIMDVLKQRVANRLDQELGNAAEEQAKVTQLKLGRLFAHERN
jgi:2-oxo-4-hydroxy-4-carboxy-5-ureidoimidazoline decarboxylase